MRFEDLLTNDYFFVPSEFQQFLRNGGFSLRFLIKLTKRWVLLISFFRIFGLVREIDRFDESIKKVLWINFSAPSIGDSIMDLSGRILLADYEVVLFTNEKNSELYTSDSVFTAVHNSIWEIWSHYTLNHFDVVICDSFSPRTMVRKLMVAPLVDFVGLYGFLNGFEVHRTYFSFSRLSHITKSSTVCKALPSLTVPSVESTRHLKVVKWDVAVGVGGEWGFRTFDAWPQVISGLLAKNFSIVLVGSKNGVPAAKAIVGDSSLDSYVGETSLTDVCEILSMSSCYVGADGGLWHLACALGVPSVVLFANCELFDASGARVTRETSDMICEVLYDNESVNGISASEVLSAHDRLVRRTLTVV